MVATQDEVAQTLLDSIDTLSKTAADDDYGAEARAEFAAAAKSLAEAWKLLERPTIPSMPAAGRANFRR